MARAPLLDHNVIECGLASSAFTNQQNKERDVLRSMGSKKVLNLSGTQKKTIVDPQRDWLYGELFEWAKDLLNESKEFLSIYYDFDLLIKILCKNEIIGKRKKRK